MDTLSGYLLSHIDDLQRDEDSSNSTEDQASHRCQVELADKIADALVLSRIKLTSVDLGAIEVFVVQSPDLAAALLNEKFTVEALKGMDAQVGRIMRLAQLKPLLRHLLKRIDTSKKQSAPTSLACFKGA